MNTINTFIAYNDAFLSCNQNAPGTACPAGQPIEFRATFFNYNPSCNTHTYTWTFPGGVERNGQNVSHAFANGNGQVVKLRVNNGTNTFDTQATINFSGSTGQPEPQFEVSIGKSVVTGNLYRFTPVITPASARSTTPSENISVWTPRSCLSVRRRRTASGMAPMPICSVAPSGTSAAA